MKSQEQKDRSEKENTLIFSQAVWMEAAYYEHLSRQRSKPKTNNRSKVESFFSQDTEYKLRSTQERKKCNFCRIL